MESKIKKKIAVRMLAVSVCLVTLMIIAAIVIKDDAGIVGSTCVTVVLILLYFVLYIKMNNPPLERAPTLANVFCFCKQFSKCITA